MSDFAQIGIEYAFAKLYVHIEGIRFDIQTPAHWRMIGRNITAPPPVVSPNSNLPQPSSHLASFQQGKTCRSCQKYCFKILTVVRIA
jgi:hypothetical protein